MPTDQELFAAEVQAMRAANGYVHAEPKGSEEFLVVHRLMYHATLMRGLRIQMDTGIEERWCYRDIPMAMAALEEWKGRDYAGEPQGWHRHPTTARRRVNGDPATEYISD